MEKLVYRVYSTSQLIKSFVVRIGAIALLIEALVHYNDNPVLVIIVSAILVLLIIFLGYEQVDIYTDRFSMRTISLWTLVANRKGRNYLFSTIKHASMPPPASAEEMAVAGALAMVQKRRYTTTPFFLELKNGESIEIITGLGMDKAKQIVDKINSLL